MNLIFDIPSLLLILTVLGNALMFSFIFSKAKNNINSISYGAVIVAVILWTLGMFFYRLSNVESVLFWCKNLYALATLTSSFFLLFTYIFPFNMLKIARWKVFLIFIPNLLVIFLIYFTDLVIVDAIFNIGEENEIVFGNWYILYILYILFYFFSGFYNLFKSYRLSSGTPREQIKYVFVGFFISANVAFTTNLVMPWQGDFSLNWLGQVVTLIWVGFTTYAILKYRLMDIRFAASRLLIYAGSFSVVAGLSLLLTSLGERFSHIISINVVVIITTLIAITLFGHILSFFQKIASKYFYYTFYNYHQVLADLGKELTKILDIDKLSVVITNTLINTMKLDRAVILIRRESDGKYVIQKNIGFKEENGISLVRDNFLTDYLEKKQKPLVYEELSLIIKEAQGTTEDKRIKDLQENMVKIEASLCLPLFTKNKLSGMIILGNKISGDPYFEQDINLLTGLSNQASVAIQNAKLYSEVQDLSENLERKVDEQVGELKVAYKKLQQLDKTKTEFMSIVSHQLRTPLSIIKGHLSMINEGIYDNNEERKREVIDNVLEANERLITLVNDVLNVSRIQAGRVEIKKENTNLEEVVEKTIERLLPNVEDKNVKLIFHPSKEKLPKINIDISKIENALLNLIDNAIKYTNQGSVEACIKRVNNSLQVEIKDTGEGMNKEELEKLFETFSRGDAGKRNWIQGAGLGLYIAKQFVEMHDGKVWAESKGEGKGSKFYMKLPL